MPYEPVTLGLKFAIRVHDLTGPDVVVVTCPACHKVFMVAPHVIYARFHKHLGHGFGNSTMHCASCSADLH